MRQAEEQKKALREAEQRAQQAEKNASIKLAQEKKAQEEADAKREANAKHNKKIKTQAKESLMNLGLDEKTSISVIMAIDLGKIKNISISY